MNLRIFTSLLVPLAVASAASAVIIDSGDGTGNTSAPAPDPGWSHVGTRGGALTLVYLGEGETGVGWVLTANHVGAGNAVFGGVTYPWVPGTAVRLDNGDGSFADLLMFAISPAPSLPALSIAAAPPPLGTGLILIGNGRNRGAATSWDPGPGPPIDGYLWGPGVALRWGTNDLESYPIFRVFDTEVFAIHFDESGSAHEAQAANGDSGGAAFASNGSGYDLAGILIAIDVFSGQPPEASFYGQSTYASDLSFYRDQIVEVMPEPAGGLWAGIALVAALPLVERSRAALH